MSPTVWNLAHSVAIPLDRPIVIAILNLTPDSFADGGRLPTITDALDAAKRAIDLGADMLDLGGESTRPGAQRVDADEQLARVLPVLQAIRRTRGLDAVPVSIDTTLAAVAGPALDSGADAINDVSAGTESPELLALAAKHSAGVILMHRLAPPGRDSYSDQYPAAPAYADVVADVRAFLAAAAERAIQAGVTPDRIVLDPGLGFGKSVDQNLALIRHTADLASLGYPIMSALSRKSFVGRVSLGRNSNPDERLPGTLALSLAHRAAGAHLFRVHDVAEHVQALRAFDAVLSIAPSEETAADKPPEPDVPPVSPPS
jgi:dihydropteroate synthase